MYKLKQIKLHQRGADAKVNTCKSEESAASNLGAMWFNETLNLGGDTDYCSTGECFFKTGIRAFFTWNIAGAAKALCLHSSTER